MGYRSDVGLAIQADALAKMIESDPSKSDKVRECLDCADEHLKSADGNHLFYWECIKWYCYDDQVALESGLNSLDSETYYFARIGEDLEDVEVKGYWWDNEWQFRVQRSLSYDESA
jgi:hypothetical protein